METLVHCHLMEPWIRSGFLVRIGRFWFIKELAPIVLIPFGYLGLLLTLVDNGAFGGFEWGGLLPELGNPPFLYIGTVIGKLVQMFEDA